MTMNVVRPARASVPSVVPRSASLKNRFNAPSSRGAVSDATAMASRCSSLDVQCALPRLAEPPSGVTPLLLLGPLQAEELHLDEPAGVELELGRGHGRRLVVGVRGHELDDHALVALYEGVDEELVGARLELEMLEGVHVDGDRDRREERRDFGLLADDALHPSRPVRDQLA